MSFDSKFKDSPLRSRTSGNLILEPLQRRQSETICGFEGFKESSTCSPCTL